MIKRTVTTMMGILILTLALALPACISEPANKSATDTGSSPPVVTLPPEKPPAPPDPDEGTEASISGMATLPDLEVDPGDIAVLTLYDLSWNEISSDTDTNPAYRFTVEKGENYILIADYSNGTSIGAVTPEVTGNLEIDITIDTELAMGLIIATEQLTEDLLPASLSRPLNDLLADANQAVENLNAFYADRNQNRSADRVAEAIRALILDRLNRSLPVYWDDMTEVFIRSYGGGMKGIRSLDKMLSDPMPPLNPHFIFTRYNGQKEPDFGMSDLETKRWDFMGLNGAFPHIVTGGDKVVFVKPTPTKIAAINENVLGIYVRDLGSSISSARLITPWNMGSWTPSLSPDQTKVAFAGRYISNPDAKRQTWRPLDIYIVDIQTKAITQVTHNPGLVGDRLSGSINPAWSPDGEALVFETSLGIHNDFTDTRMDFVIVDDPDSRSILLEGNGVDGLWVTGQPSFSPDGAQIVFSACVEDSGDILDSEILSIPADYSFNGGEIRQLTNNLYDDTRPDWSYDGRFIIFSSDREGEPGKSLSGDLNPFYVLNAYTGEVVADLGDFANAGAYYGARFCATEAVMAAVDGANKNSTGEAVISGSDSRKSATSNSDYNYYRETIPAANNIVDAYGSPAYNYGVTNWW